MTKIIENSCKASACGFSEVLVDVVGTAVKTFLYGALAPRRSCPSSSQAVLKEISA